MGFSARVLLDSISPAGVRLTTMEVTFPRFILSEFNTHRTFCLDGDTDLEFDGAPTTLRDLYSQWHGGADHFQSSKASVAAVLDAPRELRTLNLRSCNEETGEIYHTHVSDVCYSGKKDVFRVVLSDGRSIRSSKDHLFLTTAGWQRLEDAVLLRLSPDGVVTWIRDADFAAADESTRRFLPVERIEYCGERDTYDIEVKGPYHNFVADGFIVHNSRNSASSRAIPTSKLIQRVLEEPAMPVEWGKNKKGMSADEELDTDEKVSAEATWLAARDRAVEFAQKFAEQQVHKQITNRILEPFMWHTVIVTATEWDNFFTLRCAPNAQPEIRVAANLMRQAYASSAPKTLGIVEWHLPLLQDDERNLPIEEQKKISVARCARVSYLTHDGKRNVGADLDLFTRLKQDRHLSPFEHVAMPSGDTAFHANFRGWVQMRKEIEAEIPDPKLPEPA